MHMDTEARARNAVMALNQRLRTAGKLSPLYYVYSETPENFLMSTLLSVFMEKKPHDRSTFN